MKFLIVKQTSLCYVIGASEKSTPLNAEVLHFRMFARKLVTLLVPLGISLVPSSTKFELICLMPRNFLVQGENLLMGELQAISRLNLNHYSKLKVLLYFFNYLTLKRKFSNS